jgi:hypothetical protein
VVIATAAIVSVSTGLEPPCLSSEKPPTIPYLPSCCRRSPMLPLATRAQSSSENAASPRTSPTSSTSDVGELPPSPPCLVGSSVTMDAHAPPFTSPPPYMHCHQLRHVGCLSAATARVHARVPLLAPTSSRLAMGRSGVCETRLRHGVVHVGLVQNWPVRQFKSFSFISNCLNIFKGFSLIQIS